MDYIFIFNLKTQLKNTLMSGFYVQLVNFSACILLLKKVKLIRLMFGYLWGKSRREYLIKCVTEYHFYLNSIVALAVKRIKVS